MKLKVIYHNEDTEVDTDTWDEKRHDELCVINTKGYWFTEEELETLLHIFWNKGYLERDSKELEAPDFKESFKELIKDA